MKIRWLKLDKNWQKALFLLVLGGIGLVMGMMIGRKGGREQEQSGIGKIKEVVQKIMPMSINKGDKEIKNGKVTFVVMGWDPRMSVITYKSGLRSKKLGKETLMLLRTGVLLRRQDGTEEVVMSLEEPRWSHLFCPGDKIEVVIEDGQWKKITNLGPRNCAVRRE